MFCLAAANLFYWPVASRHEAGAAMCMFNIRRRAMARLGHQTADPPCPQRGIEYGPGPLT
jgi:hypothetical protein